MKMKNYIKIFIAICVIFAGLWSCSNDDYSGSNAEASLPTEVRVVLRAEQDNSGLVHISPLANGATEFQIEDFGDGSEPSELIGLGETVDHIYEEGTYNITVAAFNLNGDKVIATQSIVISFNPPENVQVNIENDTAISKKVNLTAFADFAISYEVDFGEVEGQEPLSANIGETVSYQYEEPGVYTITVEVMGTAMETTTVTQEFEVTEIQAPVTAAPNAPFRQPEDVISFFCASYEDIMGVDFNPDWGQQTTYGIYEVGGDEILQYSNINYQGIDFSAMPVDASAMEYLHLDVWTAGEENAKISIISSGPNEFPYDLELTEQEWTSFNIPLSYFTDNNPDIDLSDIIQFKLEGNPAGGTLFVDNLYFWKAPAEAETVLGTWKLKPAAGSLRVGPEAGSGDWWSISEAQVMERSCLYDDEYKFNLDGTFENILGTETWLETWQGASAEGCGAPIAPHDGSANASFEFLEGGNTVTINGAGAYLGIPKATNEGELPNVAVPQTITYMVEFSDANNMTLIIESGAGVFWTFEMIKTESAGTPLDGSWSISPVEGSLRVGPEAGSGDWWAINTAQIEERACFYDDEYIFSSNGAFTNYLGSETWLEAWQGVSADQCGAPVAPHDGTADASYSYDANAGKVTINGAGAYLGIPKATNQGELPNVAVPSSITYDVTFIDDTHIELTIESGSGVFWTFEMTKN